MRRLVLCACFITSLLLPSPGRSQNFDMQLEEVLRLIEEKSFSLALEDLRFTARQIQELRLPEAAPLFPDPPSGWIAEEPLLILPDDELWSCRLQVIRRYRPAEGGGKVEISFDFFSPLIPQAALCRMPGEAAGDPRGTIRTRPATGGA